MASIGLNAPNKGCNKKPVPGLLQQIQPSFPAFLEMFDALEWFGCTSLQFSVFLCSNFFWSFFVGFFGTFFCPCISHNILVSGYFPPKFSPVSSSTSQFQHISSKKKIRRDPAIMCIMHDPCMFQFFLCSSFATRVLAGPFVSVTLSLSRENQPHISCLPSSKSPQKNTKPDQPLHHPFTILAHAFLLVSLCLANCWEDFFFVHTACISLTNTSMPIRLLWPLWVYPLPIPPLLQVRHCNNSWWCNACWSVQTKHPVAFGARITAIQVLVFLIFLTLSFTCTFSDGNADSSEVVEKGDAGQKRCPEGGFLQWWTLFGRNGSPTNAFILFFSDWWLVTGDWWPDSISLFHNLHRSSSKVFHSIWTSSKEQPFWKSAWTKWFTWMNYQLQMIHWMRETVDRLPHFGYQGNGAHHFKMGLGAMQFLQ